MNERLLLPETLYGTTGIELSVYFSNIFETLNPANYAFHFHCSLGSCCKERWLLTPSAADVGTHDVRIEVFDDNGLQAEGTCRLEIRDPAKSTGKKLRLLMVGDSLTDQSHYPTHIHTLCRRYGIGLEMLGTNVPEKFRTLPGQLIRYPEPELLPGVRHEGYGGWSAATFLTRKEALQTEEGYHWHCASPFFNAGGEFDFKDYLERNCSGIAPDVLLIGLGGNDLGKIDENNHKEKIAGFLENMKTLYRKLRKDAPETLFGIVLNPWGTSDQDAWGKNYGCSMFQRNRRHFQPMAFRELEKYFSTQEKTFTVPLYHAIDPLRGYPSEESEAFAGSGITVTRRSNALHPNPAGYRQIGAAAFSRLLEILENHL